MSDQPQTPETTAEPPWLALYQAETERLEGLVSLFHELNNDDNSDFAKDLFATILDIAGRSAVRDFLPGSLRSPSTVDTVPRDDHVPSRCDCSCADRCPLHKAGSAVCCTLSELAVHFCCTKTEAMDRLHEWQEWCRLHPTLTESVNRDIIVG